MIQQVPCKVSLFVSTPNELFLAVNFLSANSSHIASIELELCIILVIRIYLIGGDKFGHFRAKWDSLVAFIPSIGAMQSGIVRNTSGFAFLAVFCFEFLHFFLIPLEIGVG